MKRKKFMWFAWCLMLAGALFVSCDNEDDDEFDDDDIENAPDEVVSQTQKAYILYEGSYGSYNSGLAFYAPDGNAEFVADIYAAKNDDSLGDTGNSMVKYEDNIYVVVAGSKYVACLDTSAVLVCRHEFENEPRYIAAADGYVYVTQYGGRVSKLDAVTLEEVSCYEGEDTNLEGIVECEGLLYVANGWNSDYTYNDEVLVINSATMTLETTITVNVNPSRLWEEDGKIYLISLGNYWDIEGRLEVIDPSDNSVEYIASNVSKLAEYNDVLYLVYTEYDSTYTPSNTFGVYDIGTATLDPDHSLFLNDVPTAVLSSEIYLFAIDDKTGEIYIGTSDYVNNGTIYRYDVNGSSIDIFDAGGVNPNSMLFID